MTSSSGLRVALFCVLGGLCFTTSALGTGHFAWWWLAGILISATFLPVVRLGPRNAWGQFGVIAALLVVVGLICTMTEGALFYPETKKFIVPGLIGGTVFYLIDAAALAVLAKALKLTSFSAPAVQYRSALVGIVMVVLAGFSYVLYYLVFGRIVFEFFTKKYYPHAVEQVMALGNWFWAYQWGRGLLMTLAVLPVIYTLRMPRWKAAIAVGLMIWIVGGGASLLVPSPLMVPGQRYAHIVEILTQNFSLGLTAVWLLRPKANRVPKTSEHPVSA